MIKMSYEDVLERIQEKSKLSKAEIEEMVNKKLKQLSGLISREGAAHIVANQLGIKLVEKTSGKLQIKNVLTGMRDVEIVGKVLRVFPARYFMVDGRKGQVGSIVVGDETGTIRLVLWGEQAENIQKIKENIVVKVKGGYVRERNKQKEIHLANKSNLIINPKGEKVEEVKGFSGNKKRLKDLQEGEDNVEILGTIVQVFDPRFYEICPSCGSRVVQRDGNFVCDKHNSVLPSYAYVLNLFLDDGTENIRVVCFRNQALNLLSFEDGDMQKLREKPDDFEAIKTELLGNMVKFVGRVVKNQMFDRLEFIAQLVYNNPNPEEEMEQLNKEMEEIKAKKADVPSIDDLKDIKNID